MDDRIRIRSNKGRDSRASIWGGWTGRRPLVPRGRIALRRALELGFQANGELDGKAQQGDVIN